MPAVGQGALALETRSDDLATRGTVGPLDHLASHQAVLAERTMLAALQGGCRAPIAAWGRVENNRLKLTGRVLSHDGAHRIDATLATLNPEAVQLGLQVAEELLSQGAAELIRTSREEW
jgi:hydroxymethylbilane synthase